MCAHSELPFEASTFKRDEEAVFRSSRGMPRRTTMVADTELQARFDEGPDEGPTVQVVAPRLAVHGLRLSRTRNRHGEQTMDRAVLPQLVQAPPAYGLPISESPVAAKMAAYLRLTKTPHTTIWECTYKSSTGFVPFIRWPDGRIQRESNAFIALLEKDAGLDRNLDPEALESGRSLASLVERTCFDACLHDRFTLRDGWLHQKAVTAKAMARFLPSIAIPFVLFCVRRTQSRRAAQQTMAIPEAGHIASSALIQATSSRLVGQSFLCGNRPSTVDCAIWPYLLHIAITPNATPPRDAVRSDTRLVEWIERVADFTGFEIGVKWKGAA
ncbi:MAG: hypothetical protein CL927_02800 [Deltaproteobacteria bacterium]|nr:hypothetical protein [Deltaproteobacteria bacterium]